MGGSVPPYIRLSRLLRPMFPPPCPRRRCTITCLGVACVMLLAAVSFHDAGGPEEDDRRVTVLVWAHPFGQRNVILDCQEHFQIGGCRVTDNRSAFLEAEAVIVHHRDAASGADLPERRRPGAQKWIWMNYESPTNTPGLGRFERVFNLTMTYRMDSDIFLPYGFLRPNLVGGGVPRGSDRYLSTPSPRDVVRPRLLAWVVSNWKPSHTRVAFFHQLRQHLRVDVYGRAGRPLAGDVVELIREYQFYLALENSQHTDYITEKLWNPIEAGAIPVVLGPTRKNYERFLPPEAFIHVDDFPSARELAQYLLMLRRRPELLMSHLSWRGKYRVHRPAFWSEHYCTACKAVRRTRGTTNVVKDLARWFNS